MSQLRVWIPAGIEENQDGPDVVFLSQSEELVEARVKTGRIFFPHQVVKKHTHGVHTDALGPTELTIDFLWVKRRSLPHLQFVDGIRRNEVRANEPRLLRVPFGRPTFGPAMVLRGKMQPAIRDATVRSMGGGIATRPPLSVTADEAATGAYQAMFIEVQGTLHAKMKLAGGWEGLEIRDGQQTFYALGNSELIDDSFGQFKTNSVLELRGLCLTNAQYTRNMVPFTLLLIGRDDVKVLAGPRGGALGI